jgi:tRNA 2-selenouridine synthase
MSRIGWRVTLLQGGYQAYRRFLVRDLEGLATQFHYRVVCGVTGSGKTQYLRELSLQGHQVLDLEGLAHHRGSLLGSEPEGQQPSQKSFESQIWYQLRRFDAARPVYVESESRKIGQVQLPQALIEQMRASECIELNVSLDDRIEFLCHEYAHFFEQTDLLRMKLEKLLPLVGSVQLQDWSAMIESRDWAALVASLLNTHYDPAYSKSMARNYRHYAQAQQLPYRPSRIASRSGKTFTPVS